MSPTPWKAEYLRDGGTDPFRHPPGWYATRTEPNVGSVILTFNGPFKSEAECRAWCADQNAGDAAVEALVATDVTVNPLEHHQ